jgi:hypothetical protein
MRHNGHALAMGDSMIFSLEPALNKELKVHNMYKNSSKNFQPKLLIISEQKADEMHVSPAIVNALVVRIPI